MIVRAAIARLKSDAADPKLATVDEARFDTLITSWYRAEVEGERAIDDQTTRNEPLRGELREAYTGAIRTLMPAAAKALKKTETELYDTNGGRIRCGPCRRHFTLRIASRPRSPRAGTASSPARCASPATASR